MPAAVWPHRIGSLRRSWRIRDHAGELSANRRRGGEDFAGDVALTIRRARPEDASALADLAGLDSARPLHGEVVVALLDERPVAALELSGDREVADPFWPSETALAMLRVRADQLRAGTAPLRVRGRHRARAARTAIR
jgi:hypothetical protein